MIIASIIMTLNVDKEVIRDYLVKLYLLVTCGIQELIADLRNVFILKIKRAQHHRWGGALWLAQM